MMQKLKDFYQKHKEIINYLIFGAITTVASFGAWYAIRVWFIFNGTGELTAQQHKIGSAVQWAVGVAVAFITNKKFVFVDAEKGIRVTIRQIIAFTGARIPTWFMETYMNLGMIWVFKFLGYRAFEIFGFSVSEDIWAKLITAVAVVITNYVISKLFVFKRKKK